MLPDISGIHTAVVNVNAKPITTVPYRWLVSDTNASIHVPELAVLTPFVPPSTTYPFAHAHRDTPVIHSSNVDPFHWHVSSKPRRLSISKKNEIVIRQFQRNHLLKIPATHRRADLTVNVVKWTNKLFAHACQHTLVVRLIADRNV